MSLLLLLWSSAVWGASKADDEETIRNATTVLQAMLSSKEISPSILAKADCVVILPNVRKFAVGIGGNGGRGPMSCREGSGFNGKWSPPAMYTIDGGSAGFQVGGKATDYVIVITGPSAVETVLNRKVKLGTDVSVAAGGDNPPSGGSGGGPTVVTYARTSGLFAGVSLDGASLEPDSRANERLYGTYASAKQIVSGEVKVTAAGESLVTLLDRKTGK